MKILGTESSTHRLRIVRRIRNTSRRPQSSPINPLPSDCDEDRLDHAESPTVMDMINGITICGPKAKL